MLMFLNDKRIELYIFDYQQVDGIDGGDIAAVAECVLVAALAVGVVIDQLVRTRQSQTCLEHHS